MPRSKDVDSYPDSVFKIAAIMRASQRDFCTGWMSLRLAKQLRYTWYAFVRAHYVTIERANSSINGLRLAAKDPLAASRLPSAQNLLMINRARETRLEVIRKFEVILELDMETPHDRARLRFRDKDIRWEGSGIDELFAALPESQQKFEEQIQMEMESTAPARASEPVSSAPMPDISEFFTMPLRDKIHSGIATEEDFRNSDLSIRELRDLIVAVEDNDARNRMLSLLPLEAGTPVHILPPLRGTEDKATPDSNVPLVLGEAAPQLDSPPAPAYPALALGQPNDLSQTTDAETPQEEK